MSGGGGRSQPAAYRIGCWLAAVQTQTHSIHKLHLLLSRVITHAEGVVGCSLVLYALLANHTVHKGRRL
jgi:hypothetical protein